jgi:ATP synthase protein I
VGATLGVAFLAAALQGVDGALSAVLGGLVNVAAAGAYVVLAHAGATDSPGAAVRTMLRAEAGKIVVIVVLLWMVLTMYRDVATLPLFAAFVLTVIVSQTAILTRD